MVLCGEPMDNAFLLAANFPIPLKRSEAVDFVSRASILARA
jgi:hypothetical protein